MIFLNSDKCIKHFIDVGQGDAILVSLSFHQGHYLIDTGGKVSLQSSQQKANALYTVIPYLKSQGITSLDAVFLTHADYDHIGDLPILSKEIAIKQCFYPLGCDKKPLFQRIKHRANGKIKWQAILASNIVRHRSLQMDILWPRQAGEGKMKILWY